MENNEFKEENITQFLSYNVIQKELNDHKLFGNILKHIPNVPFTKIKKEEYFISGREYELYDAEKNDYKDPKVSMTDKYIYISKGVSIAAKEIGSDFAMINLLPHFYNGKYWEMVDETMVMEFMALVAIKSGFLLSEANNIRIKKSLYNQLKGDYNILKNNKSKEIYINLQNGTLRYNKYSDSFKLYSHTPSDYFTYVLPFSYDPIAECKNFDKFLDEVLPDKASQNVLMEFLGFCFIPTPLLKLEMCLLLYGSGANGKGVVYELTRELLGKEHVSGFSMSLLSYDMNARAQIANKLLNYSSELGGRCNGDVMKKLISGEGIEAKRLYQDVFTMEDYTCKFMFNTNSLPRGSEIDGALARRLNIIKFDKTIPIEKRDPHLAEKLKVELPGIFNRVIEGLMRLLKNKKFTQSELIDKANQEFREITDTVLNFVNSKCYIHSVPKGIQERQGAEVPHCSLKELFDEYIKFCKESNTNPTNKKTFSERIKQQFYVQKGCTGNSTWVFAKQVVDLDDTIWDESNNNKSDNNDNLEDINPLKL